MCGEDERGVTATEIENIQFGTQIVHN